MVHQQPVGFALEKAERAPLSLIVSQRLRDAIVSGQLPDGAELPTEKELTEQLGVSRATVREAIRILQAQGLVTGGDTVSTQRPKVTRAHLVKSAALAMEHVVRLGDIPLEDLVELRCVIEGAAFEQAAERPDSDAMDKARAALDVMRTPNIDVESFRSADLAFHRAMVAASGNAAYALVMDVLREAILAHLGEALHRVPNPKRTMSKLTAEHEELFTAVTRRGKKRVRAMAADHIRGFYQTQSTKDEPHRSSRASKTSL